MDRIVIFISGLILGSFLNVCIYRIPHGKSISYPPSHCTNCKIRIKPYDLIPIISYVLLKGRCRYCNNKISIRYPLIELFTGIIFVGVYIKYGLSIKFIKFAVLFCFLIVIGIIDYDTTDVYDNTIIWGGVFGFIFLAINIYLKLPVKTYLLGALVGGVFISIIILLSGGMGWGDAEICTLCGLYLGIKLTILTLFLSLIIGGTLGGILILLKKKSRKDYIPFGPFIVSAAMIAMFLGERILKWYFNILF
ncbi:MULTISPECIES: prepilin peptidase [Clostridium]|uniref:Type 4 prepilin-like protein leader peptide-processing enzyme n=2 Tax=Clostridium TaxID=1485 RepID=A0A151AS10_9CLOT|nr:MULTISPECIES: A24 family peptidase [Clostridium]KYH30370.1 type 4 prepilin-like protein leader peptide-processing enzyme [Clostridium colicanis DSM 13634]MBE6044409.1 prepilin peptidase [Clostridium thermopalmarium]PRR69484.1 Type 4 prepilin-like proteins leader peptide-processing enzyme [Clostridium thermopalmarium DSM 5974]PVZ26250.1 type 4 prepilin peptidase 1 [Clostridium thermopalmarium DSM 5974]